METTIQSEMKTYSSVLEKSGAATEKKITAAIKKISTSNCNQDERKPNLVVFGVAEEEEELVEGKVLEILANLDEKPRIRYCCRVGQRKAGAIRPVKFTLASSDLAYQILRKASQLKTDTARSTSVQTGQ